MFLFLSSLLLLRRGYQILKDVGLLILPDRYGFEVGGKYSVQISDAGTEKILVLIATLSEASKYLSNLSQSTVCEGPTVKYSHIVPIVNGEAEFEGVVDKKGIYYTILSSCYSGDTGYIYRFQYSNPTSFLSYDVQPCLITLPIIAGIALILFLAWMINWFCYFSLKNSLHLYFTIGIFFTVVYDVLIVFEYHTRNKSDLEHPIYTATKVFRVLQEVVLLSAMFMASEGWSIIHSEYHWRKMILSFVLSAGIAVLYGLIDFSVVSGKYFVVAVFLVLVTCIGFYGYFMFRNVENAQTYVKAHLYVIAESGIDPQTTPIYKKYLYFKTVTVTICVYFTVLFIRSLFVYFWPLPFWVTQLIYDIVITSTISVIAFAFRMKKETKQGYLMVGDEEQEPRVFGPDDTENFDIIDEFMTKPYEEGMTLPAQPFLTDPNRKSHKDKKKKENRKEKTNEDNEDDQRRQALIDNTEL
ncbi:hypothetical protein TRFO_09532 [Tritrichomonas foetus]|uniref:Intimal thickness related receptor IRP domain-containing protein n=1 Tax=Tritrichomonas foetus TaxID=1144522 RepID=A0A1J4JG21_9EUKA|nr:hypothetical protein TRFO_09532 [Tritrichomonas foetus]|eukprot:OHS97263.1 hypothetical protein TRFO_09532 [Tritrichomonas foetus]